jgi:hypothetical protein
MSKLQADLEAAIIATLATDPTGESDVASVLLQLDPRQAANLARRIDLGRPGDPTAHAFAKLGADVRHRLRRLIAGLTPRVSAGR